MIAPCHLTPTARVSVVALTQMTNDDLAALARFGESDRVRIAAALVLGGRMTAVPEHPAAPTLPTKGEDR